MPKISRYLMLSFKYPPFQYPPFQYSPLLPTYHVFFWLSFGFSFFPEKNKNSRYLPSYQLISCYFIYLSIIRHSNIRPFCHLTMHDFWLPFTFYNFFPKHENCHDTPQFLPQSSATLFISRLSTTILSAVFAYLRRRIEWRYTSF